jgi:hypothetical protein
VSAIDPPNGASGVSVNLSSIQVTFNQPMKTTGPGSVLVTTHYHMTNSITLSSASYNPANNTVTLQISATTPLQPSTTYTLRMDTSLQNNCSQNSGGNVESSFTTASQVQSNESRTITSPGEPLAAPGYPFPSGVPQPQLRSTLSPYNLGGPRHWQIRPTPMSVIPLTGGGQPDAPDYSSLTLLERFLSWFRW